MKFCGLHRKKTKMKRRLKRELEARTILGLEKVA
jgi:hypothetical protein